MKFINSILVASAFLLLTFSSCKKDEVVVANEKGTVSVEFEHVWGSAEAPFALKKELTHPLTGDILTFEIFQYYVTSVKLKSADEKWYEVVDGDYIVDLNGGTTLDLPNVPGGEYTDIEVTYGVDSLRSSSGAQAGVLSPSKGLFWSWNSGYIMLKTEGLSPNSPDGAFAFHLGGFKGDNKVQTTKTYNFGTKLVVNGNREAEIHLLANPARLWHAADNLSTTARMTMPGAIAKTMSSTFYDAIKFDHIHN